MKKKILLVTDRPSLSRPLVRYALGLSRRLGYDVAALFVRPAKPGLASRLLGRTRSFEARAERFARDLAGRFQAQDVAFEHALAAISLPQAIEDFTHGTKRVEFALVEADRHGEASLAGISVPVHPFGRGLARIGHSHGLPGRLREICNTRSFTMSTSHTSRSAHWGKAAAALAVSAGIYAAVFANEAAVTTYFTKGGLYAALPIAAAFAFSFVYGAFAHSFWAALGIEAHRKTRVEQPRPAPRPDTRPRPTLSA